MPGPRTADGDTDDLQSLATSDSSDSETRKTAANWVKGFQEAAGGKVSVDFYDEGSQRQVVVLGVPGQVGALGKYCRSRPLVFLLGSQK
ncbi:hypothetical protein [Streptomyces inhibens]|uniref:hypothetical protein n=1 Tax=Streptomyces inhibens TaxID=2293571 RepID=UPI0015F2918D|nr:hypothetical protein [Streptomyces inhibens]